MSELKDQETFFSINLRKPIQKTLTSDVKKTHTHIRSSRKTTQL